MVRSLLLVIGLAVHTAVATWETTAPEIPAAPTLVVIVVFGTIAIAFLIGRRRGGD
jgi:hypothetical protein